MNREDILNRVFGESLGSLDHFRDLYRKGIGSDDDAVTLRELIKVINDDALWSDKFPQLKQFTGVSQDSGSRIVTAKKIPGNSADEKIQSLVKAIDDDEWVDNMADHLMKSFSMDENSMDRFSQTAQHKPVMFKGKQIDLDTVEYDMQDYSDMIFELEAAKYTDGTEVADEDLADLNELEDLVDWVATDYMDRMQDRADMMRDEGTVKEGDDKYDHEADMARSQLMRTAEKAVALFKMIKPGDNLEGWTASKITKAADYLDSVHNYMSYEMLKAQEKEKMNSIMHSEDDYHSTLESKLSKEIDNGKM